MPELRLAKTRASLPAGYQFGDASDPFSRMPDEQKTAYCEALADELLTRALRALNVIEGEHRHAFNAISGYCECGLQHLNVTEGEHFTTDRDPGDETPTRRLRRRSS